MSATLAGKVPPAPNGGVWVSPPTVELSVLTQVADTAGQQLFVPEAPATLQCAPDGTFSLANLYAAPNGTPVTWAYRLVIHGRARVAGQAVFDATVYDQQIVLPDGITSRLESLVPVSITPAPWFDTSAVVLAATQAMASAKVAATSAAASQSGAAASATSALASKNAAAASASNALASQSAAQSSADAANTSATSAAGSASGATASATSATASKNAATTSATNAAGSATAAAGSATTAGTSRDATVAAQSAAATSASNASTSATNAASSAALGLANAPVVLLANGAPVPGGTPSPALIFRYTT